MVKRWVVRAVFMLPVVVCMMGWGVSVKYYVDAEVCRNRWTWRLDSTGGAVAVGVWRHEMNGDAGRFRTDPQDRLRFWGGRTFLMLNNRPWQFSFLGVRFATHMTDPVFRPTRAWFGEVPYWLLILLFSAPLAVVWRRTRARKRGGAFPVEVKPKAD